MRGTTLLSRIASRRHATKVTRLPWLLGRGLQAGLCRHNGTAVQPPDVLALLHERGLIKDVAGDREVLRTALKQGQIGFYAGIDPTAPSLHLGHLLPLMILFWLYVHGHHTVSLIGGATAQVGDPSGRLTSRARTERTIEISNTEALYEQVKQIWEKAEAYGLRHGFSKTPAWKRTLLNNADWLLKLNVVDFLKHLGSSMRIGTMLGKDTVRNKMEKGDGMSFAEFSYPLLQGWDWWHMFRHHGVHVQVGGSDQYGNIVAGIDAIRHCSQSTATCMSAGLPPMGLTTPLLTTSSGAKFGKSAGNAVWLNAEMTSPFDLYGFLLRTTDEDVERHLKLFTFLPLDKIETTMQEHKQDPGQRRAQHLLAFEVSELVHGAEQAARTAESHKSLRAPHLASMLRSVAEDPSGTADQAQQRVSVPATLARSSSFAKLLHHAGLVTTTSEGSRLVRSGGLYVAVPEPSSDANALQFVQVTDQRPADIPSFTQSDLLVLRLGKWKVKVVHLLDEDMIE